MNKALRAVPSPGEKDWKEPSTPEELIRAVEWYFQKQIEPQRKRLYFARLRQWQIESPEEVSKLFTAITEQCKYLPNIAELVACLESALGAHWRWFRRISADDEQQTEG